MAPEEATNMPDGYVNVIVATQPKLKVAIYQPHGDQFKVVDV